MEITAEEMDKILLNYIKSNNLLDNFEKSEVSDYFELVDTYDEWVDDWEQTWSGGKDGNAPAPQVSIKHYEYNVTRNYHFKVMGLQFGINIPEGKMEKEANLDGKRLPIDDDIYSALEKDIKRSEELMSFICNILGIDVENVVSNSIRDNAELEYQALNDELAEVKKEMYSCLTDITECKISLNKYISELENSKNNNSNNNNSNNIPNKVKDINKLVIKHIKAFNLLKNSEKIKLIDKYIYKDSYEADDEIARESIKIGLFPDLHYIYDHKRVYEFNINGLDYKIEIPDESLNTIYEKKQDELEKTIDDASKILNMLAIDNDENSYLIPLLISTLNIDINKIISTPDAENIYDKMINLQEKLATLDSKYFVLSEKREVLLKKINSLANYLLPVDNEEKAIKPM